MNDCKNRNMIGSGESPPFLFISICSLMLGFSYVDLCCGLSRSRENRAGKGRVSATTPKEVSQGLGLYDLKNRKWHIQGTCALKGDGLYKGLDWLASSFKEHKAGSSVGPSF